MTEAFSRHITLYSPVLPMMTGTADYFEHVLETLKRRSLPTSNMRIVVDDDHWKSSQRRTSAFGYPIVDYRSVPNVVEPDETRVFFVANNELHAYVHRALSQLRKLKGGRVISVIHDVSCSMLLKHLSFNGIYNFSPSRFVEINRSQLGELAGKLIDDRQSGHISEVFEFVTHAQGATLAASDEIWTHSRFGALKLILESDIPVERLPVFRYCRHPAYDDGSSQVAAAAELQPGDAKPADTYRFGIFGWVSPPKRVYEALRALRLMLARLSPEDRKRVEFIVVGKLPAPDFYNPVDYAQSIGVAPYCRFFGFVDGPRFRGLIDSSDCVLNLRFPSCGESSGAGAHARGSGVDLIVSSCQAFNEEEATAHIEPLSPLEELILAGEMTRLFNAWRERGKESPPPSSAASMPPLASLDNLLAAEAWVEFAQSAEYAREGGGRAELPKNLRAV